MFTVLIGRPALPAPPFIHSDDILLLLSFLNYDVDTKLTHVAVFNVLTHISPVIYQFMHVSENKKKILNSMKLIANSYFCWTCVVSATTDSRRQKMICDRSTCEKNFCKFITRPIIINQFDRFYCFG